MGKAVDINKILNEIKNEANKGRCTNDLSDLGKLPYAIQSRVIREKIETLNVNVDTIMLYFNRFLTYLRKKKLKAEDFYCTMPLIDLRVSDLIEDLRALAVFSKKHNHVGPLKDALKLLSDFCSEIRFFPKNYEDLTRTYQREDENILKKDLKKFLTDLITDSEESEITLRGCNAILDSETSYFEYIDRHVKKIFENSIEDLKATITVIDATNILKDQHEREIIEYFLESFENFSLGGDETMKELLKSLEEGQNDVASNNDIVTRISKILDRQLSFLESIPYKSDDVYHKIVLLEEAQRVVKYLTVEDPDLISIYEKARNMINTGEDLCDEVKKRVIECGKNKAYFMSNKNMLKNIRINRIVGCDQATVEKSFIATLNEMKTMIGAFAITGGGLTLFFIKLMEFLIKIIKTSDNFSIQTIAVIFTIISMNGLYESLITLKNCGLLVKDTIEVEGEKRLRFRN